MCQILDRLCFCTEYSTFGSHQFPVRSHYRQGDYHRSSGGGEGGINGLGKARLTFRIIFDLSDGPIGPSKIGRKRKKKKKDPPFGWDEQNSFLSSPCQYLVTFFIFILRINLHINFHSDPCKHFGSEHKSAIQNVFRITLGWSERYSMARFAQHWSTGVENWVCSKFWCKKKSQFRILTFIFYFIENPIHYEQYNSGGVEQIWPKSSFGFIIIVLFIIWRRERQR